MDSQFFYRGVEVCSDHAMTQLLLKTDLGNISCLMDSRRQRDSRIHRIELEDCRVKVCSGYINRAGRELGGCSRRYIEYVKEGLE